MAFYDVKEGVAIIPDSETRIERLAFADCTDLKSVTIPGSVTEIGSAAFKGCTSLTSIIIPDSVTGIGRDVFRGCTGLASIVVTEGNKSFDSRDNCNAIIATESNWLGMGCQNTVIPDSVTMIVEYAFHDCTSLTSINIPDSVHCRRH